MDKTKLSKAMAMAIAGVALSAGGISAASADIITMYNTYNAGAAPGVNNSDGTTTDGWVYGSLAAPGAGIQGGFVGIGGSSTPQLATPFGYNASPSLNWGAEFSSSGSAIISSADSLARYGIAADIDIGQGTWSDANRADLGGWKHNIDSGLIKVDFDGTVTLNARFLTQNGDVGFTILKGMSSATDTNTAYGHHGVWNNSGTAGPQNSTLLPGGMGFTADQIVATTLGATDANPTAVNLNTISFHVEADQVYTVLLGGYRNGPWNVTTDGYVLDISAVPEPASLSLFGIAFAAMGAARRRNAGATA